MPRKKDKTEADEAPLRKIAKEDILQFIHSSPGNIGRREIARAFGIKGAVQQKINTINRFLLPGRSRGPSLLEVGEELAGSVGMFTD